MLGQVFDLQQVGNERARALLIERFECDRCVAVTVITLRCFMEAPRGLLPLGPEDGEKHER